jgi:flagellar motor switch protein FliN
MSERHDQLVPVSNANNVLKELAPVHDIPLHVSIEVGRLKLTVRDFVRLGAGSVLDLKKPAGEPFEIALNGHLVARGEVIMVEQSSGVRVVEVLKPAGTA